MNLHEIMSIIIDETFKKELYTGLNNQRLEKHINDLLANMKSNYIIKTINPLNVSGVFTFENNENNNCDDFHLSLDDNSYLIYDLTGHNGEWRIVECKSLEKVEEEILSEAGYLNMFTTDMVIIKDFEVKKFKIYQRNSNGEIKYVEDFEECDREKELKIQWF